MEIINKCQRKLRKEQGKENELLCFQFTFLVVGSGYWQDIFHEGFECNDINANTNKAILAK